MLACAIFGWASSGAAEAQQSSFGPLGYEEGSPLQRLAYTPTTEGADVVGEGAWRVDLHNGLSNIFEQDSSATHVLFLDLERLTSSVAVRWGASETLELADGSPGRRRAGDGSTASSWDGTGPSDWETRTAIDSPRTPTGCGSPTETTPCTSTGGPGP